MRDEREHRRRAIAHLKSAVRYEKRGFSAKARAHFGRAMHYGSGFGNKLSELPDEIIEMIVRYGMDGSTEVSASWLAFPVKVNVPAFLAMSAEDRRKHVFYPFYIRTVRATARESTHELLLAYGRLTKRSDSSSIAGALTTLRIMIVEHWYHMCPYRFHDLVSILYAKESSLIIIGLCRALLDTFMSHLDSTEECTECKILRREETKMQIRGIINKTFEPRAIDVDMDGKVVTGFVKKYESELDNQKAIYGHLCVWKTGMVRDMTLIFGDVRWKDEEWDVRLWDTSLVRNMRNAFYDCRGLLSGVECWSVSDVRNMSYMFNNAIAFNRDISSWDTRSVLGMRWMFGGADSFDQDIGNWDTSNVEDMSYMFYRAHMFNRDIGKWDTSKVGSMRNMFSYATSFNQPIGKWNTSLVHDMGSMFSRAGSFNQDISKWNTSNVRNMSGMFYGASSFNQDIGGWNMSKVRTGDLDKMFDGATAMEHKNKPPVTIQP
jgi:surface protein